MGVNRDGLSWIKFYPTDHMSDSKVKLCSLAARGLWIEMICIMHEGTPYGHLVSGKKILGAKELARLTGADEKEIRKLLEELETNGVFSKNKAGAFFSRRLVKDQKKRKINQENGRLGGNPSLSNRKRNIKSDNLKDNLKHKPKYNHEDKTQSPITRVQTQSLDSGNCEWPNVLKEYLTPKNYQLLSDTDYHDGVVYCNSKSDVFRIEQVCKKAIIEVLGLENVDVVLKH